MTKETPDEVDSLSHLLLLQSLESPRLPSVRILGHPIPLFEDADHLHCTSPGKPWP